MPINTNIFKPEDSRVKDAITHLENLGFEAYGAGIKKGECNSKYVVVRDATTMPYLNISSVRALYSVMMYVPEKKPLEIESFKYEVMNAMKGLYPMFIRTGNETQSFHDADIKAFMVSVQYRCSKRIENY